MNAQIIIDLMFGDSGKGITADFLSQQDNSIVVRFSGGQQAGHNVRIGDISHVHSNYGSGTLRGVPSFFSEHCTIYPLTMYREKKVLKNKGIYNPILFLHPLANLTTPCDVIYNRIRERKVNHGSCGLGVAATMQRNINTGYKLYAIDLLNMDILWKKINNIADYYLDNIISEDKIQFNNELRKELDLFYDAVNNLNFNIKNYNFLKDFSNIVFEGSQGIMLDMNHGIFPNVTYANTTSKNAIEICNKLSIKNDNISVFYVTRSYQTRHGNGWMSNEADIKLINVNETNVNNEWQGNFRIGNIDYDLLNYALNVDNIYSNKLLKNIVITCMDQRPDFVFELNKLNHKFHKVYYLYSSDSQHFIKK